MKRFMGKSFRDFVESIVYAGMKPGVPRSQTRRMRWLGRFREPLERFLNSAGSDDPFYLTNRTWGERVRVWVLLALPCVVVASVIALGVWGLIEKKEPQPARQLTPAQIAARMLPDLNKPIDLNVNSDLEVVEVRIREDGKMLVGAVRNRTGRPISHAELVVDLTDVRGSRLGAVSAPIGQIAPKGTASFELPIQQHGAAFALVREVVSQ
jgi:hypothetical protein